MRRLLALVLFCLASTALGQPANHWNSGGVGCLPCSTQRPYTASVCPDNFGKTYYLRYDASLMESAPWTFDGISRTISTVNFKDRLSLVMPARPQGFSNLSPMPDEAWDFNQGGAQHTDQFLIQTFAGSGFGWIVGLRSGQTYPGPGTILPAPYRDVPVRNRPGLMLCDVYRQVNGPGALPCPSGVPTTTYAAQVMSITEWTLAWPVVNATHRIPRCSGPQPTATRTATKAPTVVPTPVGAHQFADWVYDATTKGFLAGCGGGKFCPGDSAVAQQGLVTRAQSCVFMLKARFGPDYTPPACTPPGSFSDVRCGQ